MPQKNLKNPPTRSSSPVKRGRVSRGTGKQSPVKRGAPKKKSKKSMGY